MCVFYALNPLFQRGAPSPQGRPPRPHKRGLRSPQPLAGGSASRDPPLRGTDAPLPSPLLPRHVTRWRGRAPPPARDRHGGGGGEGARPPPPPGPAPAPSPPRPLPALLRRRRRSPGSAAPQPAGGGRGGGKPWTERHHGRQGVPHRLPQLRRGLAEG